MRNIKRTTRTARNALQRWLAATPRDQASAYRAWQVAESARRRAIDKAIPFNERYATAPAVIA